MVICWVFVWGKTKVALLKEKDFVVVSQEDPDSDVEFSLVYQHWALDVLLDNETQDSLTVRAVLCLGFKFWFRFWFILYLRFCLRFVFHYWIGFLELYHWFLWWFFRGGRFFRWLFRRFFWRNGFSFLSQGRNRGIGLRMRKRLSHILSLVGSSIILFSFNHFRHFIKLDKVRLLFISL